MDQQVAQKIAFFFTPPNVEPSSLPGQPPKALSVLYILRRDYHSCVKQSIYLFPATMAMFAGIDLLAKFYAGSNSKDRGAVRRRFIGFLDAYFQPIEPADADALFRLRNALMHSFSLYDENIRYSIAEHAGGQLITRRLPGLCTVGVVELHNALERAIASYIQHLVQDQGLQKKFDRMFRNYGTTEIGITTP